MKPSRYNKIVWLEDEKRYLLFNGISAALLKFNVDSFKRISGILEGEKVDNNIKDSNILSALKKGLFVVPEDLVLRPKSSDMFSGNLIFYAVFSVFCQR